MHATFKTFPGKNVSETYVSSGVKSAVSLVNWGSKFVAKSGSAGSNDGIKGGCTSFCESFSFVIF